MSLVSVSCVRGVVAKVGYTECEREPGLMSTAMMMMKNEDPAHPALAALCRSDRSDRSLYTRVGTAVWVQVHSLFAVIVIIVVGRISSDYY